MPTIQQALSHAVASLHAVADVPQLEAEILLAFVLGEARSYLYAWPEKELTDEQWRQFGDCVERRKQKEPIAYVTGSKEFWSLDLRVTKATLVPRPETELLVEQILAAFPKISRIQVADLGTGSGAIAAALAVERPDWDIAAVDNNSATLAIAQENAQRLHLKNIHFYCGNWCEPLPRHDFDVIVSNPPYIAETEWSDYEDGLLFEPRGALVSGRDGLVAIREISQGAKQYLKAGGLLLLEHGASQGESVRFILHHDGYKNIHTLRDLFGQERVTTAQF